MKSQANIGSNGRIGFVHLVEHFRKDESGIYRLIDQEEIHNLIPTEGLDHILNIAMRNGTPVASWYVALFEGNYTPVAGLTAATFPSAATECTAYDEATRPLWNSAAASNGVITNSANKAVFTMNATKTVYGIVMTSANAKSATSGVLTSAVRFAASKNVAATDILNVTSSITLTSS